MRNYYLSVMLALTGLAATCSSRDTLRSDAENFPDPCSEADASQVSPVPQGQLPHGACVNGGERCSILTRDSCANGYENGPVIQWTCVCDGRGTWGCTKTGESLSICDADAGNRTAGDAALVDSGRH
jgi:hypothetical protein